MNQRAPSFEAICHTFTKAGDAPQDKECIPSETLCAAVAGELGPEQMQAVILHCSECPACAEDWRLTRAFADTCKPALAPLLQEGAMPGSPDSTVISFDFHRRNRNATYEMHREGNKRQARPWRLLAVASSFATIGWYSVSQINGEEESYADEITVRGDSPNGPVAEIGYRFDGQRFVWPDFSPGARYRISIYLDGFKEAILTDKLSTCTWEPDKAALELLAQEPKVWRVQAITPEGILRDSPPQPFRGAP